MSQHSVSFNEEKRHAVYARDGYKCAYCGRHDETRSGAGLSLDHITSREHGGEGSNVKQLSSIASRGELQERLAAHASGAERPHGPGVCHDEQGHFVACRLAVVRAARDLAAVIRARLRAAA